MATSSSLPGPDDRLESWKEIATYLGREVRTAQLWEKNEGLPVHRLQVGKQGSVFASKQELDAWLARRAVSPTPPENPPAPPTPRQGSWWLALAAAVVILAAAGSLLWRAQVNQPITSVVVLPFLDLSPGHDQEYFSDGLTEEIIDAMSRVPNLRVVARTTAFSFKGKNQDIRDIGKQLNVAAVIEGSVRKSDDNLRITAQLNRVVDGYHIWSKTYDRQLRDVFAVQSEISQTLADQMRAGRVPARRGTANLEAFDAWQEGRYFFNQHLAPESYLNAIDRYKVAIAKDPNFALAWSSLADAYAYMSENFAAYPKEAMPKAKEAAEKALALDDGLAEAHTSAGIVKLDYEWDAVGAEREMRRAMELNPSSGYLHHWYAHSLEAQGKLDEAMKEMRTALALDPVSIVILWDIANELLLAGRNQEAFDELKKGLTLFPNHPVLLCLQTQAAYLIGDRDTGRQAMETLKGVVGGLANAPAIFAGFIGYGAAMEGRTAEARAALDLLERKSATEYIEPLLVPELCLALKDRACVRKWLQRGHDERSSLWPYMKLEKTYYAGDPEAEALIFNNP